MALISKWLINFFVVGALGLWNVVRAAPQVPFYFIFGDSLVDNGNNNRLKSLARADYLPYGIDFPGGPSGRFSSGKTIADAIDDCYDVDINIITCGPGHGISIASLENHNSKACVSNITVRDLVIKVSNKGVRIKTWQGGSGSVSEFSNIHIEGRRKKSSYNLTNSIASQKIVPTKPLQFSYQIFFTET